MKVNYLSGDKTLTVDSKTLNPMKAIRIKCLDCSGGSQNEVKLCQCSDCPLYVFRLGKNPNRVKKTLTPEHVQRMQAGLAKSRGKDQ